MDLGVHWRAQRSRVHALGRARVAEAAGADADLRGGGLDALIHQGADEVEGYGAAVVHVARPVDDGHIGVLEGLRAAVSMRSSGDSHAR